MLDPNQPKLNLRVGFQQRIVIPDTLEHLPTALVDCCEDMISILWDLGVIPALVKRFISFP